MMVQKCMSTYYVLFWIVLVPASNMLFSQFCGYSWQKDRM
jgi:hypothetical protein